MTMTEACFKKFCRQDKLSPDTFFSQRIHKHQLGIEFIFHQKQQNIVKTKKRWRKCIIGNKNLIHIPPPVQNTQIHKNSIKTGITLYGLRYMFLFASLKG